MDFIGLKFWQRGTGSKADAKAAATVVDAWWTTVKGWLAFPFTVWDVTTAPLFIVDALASDRYITRYTGEPESLYRLRVEHAYANAKDAGSTAGFVRIWERLGLGNCFIVERPEDDDWDIVYIDMAPEVFAGNETLIMTLLNQYGRTCRRYRVSTTSVVSMSVAAPYSGFDTAFNVAVSASFTGEEIIDPDAIELEPGNILENGTDLSVLSTYRTAKEYIGVENGLNVYKVTNINGGVANSAISFAREAGKNYRIKMYVKPGDTHNVLFAINNSGYKDNVFNLSTKTIVRDVEAQNPVVEALDNGWYTIEYTFPSTSQSGVIYIGPAFKDSTTYTAAAGNYIYVGAILAFEV